jgi:hypothetical protein
VAGCELRSDATQLGEDAMTPLLGTRSGSTDSIAAASGNCLGAAAIGSAQA